MKTGERKSPKARGMIRIVVLLFFGFLLGTNIYSFNAKSLGGNPLPMPLGVGGAIVLSGSMEPACSVGDLVLVKETQDIEVDDVIVFMQGRSLVVHRVLETDGTTIVTKGDANNAADAPILMADVKGKVVVVIPGIGHILSAIKTPVGTLIVILAAIALIEIPRRLERQKDDEERQQIIDEIKRLKDE